MTDLDVRQFQPPLRKAIEQYRTLVSEAADARASVEAARVALRAAREADQSAAVAAKLEGRSRPEHGTAEEAEGVLKAAEWDEQVARRAALASLDKIPETCRDPKTTVALEKRKAELTQASIAALDTLDHLLDQLQAAKAHLSWLKSPVQGDRLAGVQTSDLWVLSEGHRKANGEPGEAADLTRAVRLALEGADRAPENPAASYGLPVGTVLGGPFGSFPPLNNTVSQGAAKLFAEQAGDALVDED